MNKTLLDIFSYSVGIGAVIGLVRYKKAGRTYLPFILLLWTAIAAEIVSTICINVYNTNAVSSNIYVLVESLLIIWFFKNLGSFRKNVNWFFFLLVLFLGLWTIDNFLISTIFFFPSYFRIFYSLVVVLMSIQMINWLIIEEKKGLVRNPVFLIMVGFILFFTLRILIEVFWVGLVASQSYYIHLYRIMAYVNLFVNLIFALATLWMEPKREYTLL